jgi:predicted bacteriocin transport accessory protein
MKKLLIGLGIALVVLAGIAAIASFISTNENSQYLEKVPYDQVVEEIQTEETVIAYYSSKTCPYCVEFEPTLLEALKSSNYQARKVEVSESSENDVWGHMNEVASKFLGTTGGTPMVVIYQGGEPIDAITGKVELESVLEFFEVIDNEQ